MEVSNSSVTITGSVVNITASVAPSTVVNVGSSYASSSSFIVTTMLRNITTSFLDNVTTSFMDNVTTARKEICTPPAFHEFPPDAFTDSQRAHGAFVLHLIFAIYMFIALAIVCDDYFVASLDKVCERLGFSEDVAGATFMAAGSSAPELFTAIIGVFITKGDVGVGTIVGSAVFNILFVIGICGLVVKETIRLSWWPMCRDSLYYAIAIIVLILVVYDSTVTWYESLIMLILYAGYILIMRFNRSLQNAITSKLKWFASEKVNANGVLGKQLNKFQDYEQFGEDDDVFSVSMDMTDYTPRKMSVDHYATTSNIKLTFEEAAFKIMMTRYFSTLCRFKAAVRLAICYNRRMQQDQGYQRRQKFQQANRTSTMRSYTKSVRNWVSMALEGEDVDGWKTRPDIERLGYLAFIRWLVLYPIRILLYYTIPDCRKIRWERYFVATFLVSIVWIMVFSYVMVWMVTYIGYALSIPDSVMGITFLAAGTSIPDAMASVIVARQGMGDMAVSNVIGSNIFDILLGLSFPWFLKTAIVYPGSNAHINSNGMVFNIVLLFLTVLLTIGAVHSSGWILNKCVGIVCLTVYAVYLVFATMIECNVFGFVNPPMC